MSVQLDVVNPANAFKNNGQTFWDDREKVWWVNESNVKRYDEMLEGKILIRDRFIVASCLHDCWICQTENKVVAIGSDDYLLRIENGGESKWKPITELTLFANAINIPENIAKCISNRYTEFKLCDGVHLKSWKNTCSGCGAVQKTTDCLADIFRPDSIESAEKISLRYVHVKYDFAMTGAVIQSDYLTEFSQRDNTLMEVL